MANSDSDISALCDSFNSQAANYERRMGGSTREVAAYVVSLLSKLPDRPIILDNACGPGCATIELLKVYTTAYVHAADVAPGMVSLADGVVAANGWKDSVETAVMDGMSLGYSNETFDASITNFGIFFFPDPVVGARELYRTLKPGGKAAVTCWKQVPYLSILRAVQEIIRPGSPPVVLRKLEEWTRKETMEATLKEAGFEQVETYEKEVMWWNKDIDNAAKGFADNFVNMVGDQWTQEDKERILGTTVRVLQDRGPEFVTGSEATIGFRMVAWISIATKTTSHH